MSNRRSVMVVKIDPPEKNEEEWNKWYNNKHLPARLALPGFLAARRFVSQDCKIDIFAKDQGKYLALYELANTDALKSEAFQKLKESESASPPESFDIITQRLPKFKRGIYEQVFPEEEDYSPASTRFLLLAEHELPSQYEEEYDVWYNTEHIPAITQVPGFFTPRRFKLSNEFPSIPDSKNVRRFITIYDIDNIELFDTDIFRKQSTSPWTRRMQGLYTQKLLVLYHRIYPES